MKIIVCVKVVKGEVNPFDQSALECALRLSRDVTVISMGPEACRDTLLPLTRLGAKVVLVSDNLFAGSDTLATSYILSCAIKHMEYDLIICGRQSVDGDTAQVGPMVAQKLSLPLITNAMTVSCDENTITATTRTGGEKADLPALVTLERGYVLRFPSIFSKVGNVEIIDNKSLCCDPSACGINGSPTRVLETYENQRGKRNCKFITRDNLESLVKELLETPALNQEETQSAEKLETVWAVGEKVVEAAEKISDNVILISEAEVDLIAERAKAEKPDAILWNGDLCGRKHAPVVASILNTGLCADCTRLDVEDGNLIMYRPAGGGNIYAKIKCLTNPAMATVRTNTQGNDIILSGGKGVEGDFEKLKSLANTLGAQLGASRGLVDTGVADYEMQVGLTGKTVSPKIYIAVGISGAVQHTCAIEGAQWVIAINPDKDARIFEYADYGIIDNL